MLQVSLKGDASGFSYMENDGAKLFRDHFKGVTYHQVSNNCFLEDRAKN
jgi:hypothetical protein